MKCPSDSNVKSNENLLWVHQEPWQQQLMLKYRNMISQMDATYEMIQCDLPLFSKVFVQKQDTLVGSFFCILI